MSSDPHARRRRGRFIVRLGVFLLAAALALPVLPTDGLIGLWPGLSPWLSLGAAAAARRWTPWALLGMPLIVLSLLRGPWFCARLCPMGFAVEPIGRMAPTRADRFRRCPVLGRWLVLVMAGGIVAGYPLFLWMDPLALFNGFFSAWRRPWVGWNLLPAMGFVVVMAGSVMWPQVWCRRVCPLGGLQTMLGTLGQTVRRRLRGAPPGGETGERSSAWGPVSGRRAFLAALAGLGIGLGMRRWGGRGQTSPVRPPGAVPESAFRSRCARCGNCFQACPHDVLKPDLEASRWSGFLAPVVVIDSTYCNEWCHACTQVCPTGAIRRLGLEDKRNTSIGLAEISKSRCLAWEKQEYCMVCHEFCPYLAIRTVTHRGVNCPEVDPAMCRGCGACQANCPAIPVKAIMVGGREQKRVRALPSFDPA